MAGAPAYQKWLYGTSTVGATQEPGTWEFQAQDGSLLELCPDTMTDTYEVRGEIQHAARTKENQLVGFYFRCLEPSLIGGRQVFRWWGVGFCDYPLPPPPAPSLPTQGVQVTDRMVFPLTESGVVR